MAARLTVAICITTFRRPQGLQRLLTSLDTLTFERVTAPQITVFVVDNNADQPLSDTYPDLRSWTRLPVNYRIEQNRGLVHARNAALAAVDGRHDVLAFIDDDEWAEPQWLEALIEMRARSGAMVVQGMVRPEFARPPEPWMRFIGIYEVGPFADAEELTWGASGNCLIDKRMLDATGLTFDAAFNLSGGEDTDLFDRLLRAGQRVVAAPNAVAYETVPAERMCLSWAVRRSYRLGHTLGRISVARRAPIASIARLAKSMGRLGFGIMQVLLLGPFSRSIAVKGATNIAWSIGTLAAFARRDVAIYTGRKI